MIQWVRNIVDINPDTIHRFADYLHKHYGDSLRERYSTDKLENFLHEQISQPQAPYGSKIIEELIDIGTNFDHTDGQLHLTQEGGHSHRRIAHVKDATGRAIGEALLAKISPHANIQRLENHAAIDLVCMDQPGSGIANRRCYGAYVLSPDEKVISISARHTILATGGAGKVYLYTSNPHAASGDGIAMAWRAGCNIMNLEFMQFHPTCLYHPEGSNMLLSEALRGEGALLLNKSGDRFMFEYDGRGELAPRDIVARAIDHEIKKSGSDCMYLDARPIGAESIRRQFPNIHERLLELGLDMTSQPIPVVPAAHYICGGIQTDVAGRTSIPGLYAIGETACTGLHGANRLASNSLLECLVMADLCSNHILAHKETELVKIPAWDDSGLVPESERIQIKQNWEEIRAIMSHYVGIVRSNERLRRARRRLRVIEEEISAYYWKHPVTQDLIELRNLELVAELIVQSALKRRESRGLHYSTDYPETGEQAVDTILSPEI